MVYDFGKIFIPEHIFISSPTYLKIKKIHDINFFDVYIMSFLQTMAYKKEQSSW